MDADAAARTIQLVLAPVVMVTACALVLGTLLGRYGAVNDRLRAMARERLELVSAGRAPGTERFAAERLQEIDVQLPELLRRHTLLHYAVVVGYGAVLVFIMSMFVLAAAVSSGGASTAVAALWVFLAGTGALLLAVLLALLEALVSHRAVQYEVGRVRGLEHRDRDG
ncbi:MAG TPA: DUF2721 domain-containing protein [Chloroflexota bacterium]|nr:DUF2721 domain-containing protein [Chloroflexota bacterium]